MPTCDTCGTLLKMHRKRDGVDHLCPKCDAPSDPPRGPVNPPGASSSAGGGSTRFQRASTLAEPAQPQAGAGTPSIHGGGSSDRSPQRAGMRTGPPPEGAGRFFPFEQMRPGQERFIQDVRRCLKDGKILVAQAPTGIGKTAGVLAPALEVAARSSSKVFFLTSKQSQHKVAINTLKLTEAVSGTDVIVSDMISKKAMCPRPESETLNARAFGEFCTKAMTKGTCSYYEEDEEDVFRELAREIHHVEDAVKLSERAHVCPYKALTETARIADVIVLDYNHFFSDLLNTTLDRFQTELDDAILIIDEAHNLPDRIRSHLTWHLTPGVLGEASDEARKKGAHPMAKFLRLLADHVASLEGNEEQPMKVRDLLDPVDQILDKAFALSRPDVHGMLDELSDIAEAVLKEESVSACQDVLDFLERWPQRRVLPEKKVLRMWNPDIGGITYEILDAATLARPIFEGVRGAVLMSGTLYPMQMYGSILGVPRERGVYERYENPFPRENRRVVIDLNVSSKMSHRGPDTYRKIGSTIVEVGDGTPGNVAAFFPSYAFMEAVVNRLPPNGRELLIEERSHDKQGRERLVRRLEDAGGNALLLGVQGGSLSEGYDFVQDGDNLLKSVLVIGVPYAPPTTEVKALRTFYDEAFGQGKGWQYGYLAPAIQRVLQAAGRAVRASDHRAFVALMDHRFSQRQLQNWLPPSMEAAQAVDDVPGACRRFFS